MASTTPVPASNANASMARFEAQTTRYGSITMSIGLLLSLAGPAYIFFFSDLQITAGMVWLSLVAVAATFGVLWFVEPLTYFPILGSAAMYQAFMIGNISNKLLPAAIVAQSTIGAKAGTKRGDLAAVMAICGAATVHLTSLLIFVGLLGTWLVTRIPTEVIEVARLYILPSLMGAVLVQAIVSMKQLRPTLVAIGLALCMQFLILPNFQSVSMFSTALVVIFSILVSWLVRDRKKFRTNGGQ
ncbi:hypothetical protein OK351_16355 [Glutamicibacter sp. MNS18]|uniref:hypothetical protein n=1 Tax=Glutamicibacter sp. MNS18 TaxID=2989817 RepID=UPI0022369D97|nr:hypothetical protein [Glutamicibacter sp. MNS18]MCW4467057.1 hypothetical protein [Glutamicibacter sp. MNS18]